MAYRYENNIETGEPDLVIDGWENGIADSPYHGITSLKNLNITFLPGAVYSNYKRSLNSPATGMTIPKYWSRNPVNNVHYIQDSANTVWFSADATNTWAALAGSTSGTGSGLVVFKNYIFAFRLTEIDYYNIAGSSWTNNWQPNGVAPTLISGEHMTIWGTDDIMYFCNGRYIGSLQENPGTVFDPNDATTYTYNEMALTLPSYVTTTWLSELGVDLIIAAGKQIFPWDRTSTDAGIPLFINEDIKRIKNILNNLYITAGVKGNLYISNGYNVSPWVKIPDSFFGIIDPQIAFGDIMSHRNKVYVGACQSSPSGGVAGIFSIDINTKNINFENQSSYGLTTTAALNGAPQVLIDIDRAEFDQYVSAWYNGSVGGVDSNSNTVYTSGECIIESDLIPIGGAINKKTFSNAEFKLDKFLDGTITLSARPSLSDSYTQLGTTTLGAAAAVISDIYTPITIQESQWIQFKIVISGVSSTSFNRLREIRIR